MDKGAGVKGEDVALDNLEPLQERRAVPTGYKKILSSIKAVGLIEPLCAYKENGKYVIVDGYLRYKACKELDIDTVPCLIVPTKEAYTPNRMVNHLSAVQETRMLRQSLDTLDEDTIALAFGLVSIKHRKKDRLLKKLHPSVIDAFDKKSIPLRVCAEEFTFVKPEYQAVILKDMKKTGDFSAAYARTLILRAPENMRLKKKRSKKNPWKRGAQQKKDLGIKLAKAEQRFDFYAGLYRDYVADFLKLSIYFRKLITNKNVGPYLKAHHGEMLDRFQTILFEAEDKKGK